MIDPSLLEAYLKTTYEVYYSGKIIRLRINEYNPQIDSLLENHGSKSWVFITAFNPYSLKLSEKENISRQEKLLKEITGLKYITLPGAGKPDSAEWGIENSLLVLDLPGYLTERLAKKYEQNAVVTGKKGGNPTLKFYT